MNWIYYEYADDLLGRMPADKPASLPEADGRPKAKKRSIS